MRLVGWHSFVAIVLCALVSSAAARAEEPAVAADANPVVEIETTMGRITAELDAKKAPISTQNFLAYARDGYYEGTIFHRVIADEIIQGGGVTVDLKPKPGQRRPIESEAANGLENRRGTLAMARLRAPNTATSQFFINVADNPFLNHRPDVPEQAGFAVFGRVIDGMDVVDAIKNVPTGNRDMIQDVPLEPVTIKRVTVRP